MATSSGTTGIPSVTESEAPGLSAGASFALFPGAMSAEERKVSPSLPDVSFSSSALT